MSNKQFLGKLLQKLKVGDSRSIHLNALPGNFARLDIYDLVNIDQSLHLKFIQLLLSKPSFTFSISIDPGLADKKKKEEGDIIRKMVRRLNLMYYQEQDEFLEHGTKTFGFGFPLLIKRDPNNPKKIIKAPLFIWHLDLQKDTQRNNTWTISRREEEHPLMFNEMLRTHLESTEHITVDDLALLCEDDILDEKTLSEACSTVLKKLGVDAAAADLQLKILPGSDRESIEKITGDSPWIRWSGIFGLYKTQKQSIIKDIEDLMGAVPGFDFNPVFPDFLQENLSPVSLDPSQEAVLNNLGTRNKVIIQGPPGTGKSQTLTAIITNALYNNATCLVVCEKRTALEVIQQNLDRLGLGELCVLVDDVYADRQKVVERVRQVTDNPAAEPPFRIHEHEQLRNDFLRLRKELNRHLGIVNNRFFGDDNWLDLTGEYLGAEKKYDPAALAAIPVEAFELDYKEYTALQPVMEEGEKYWQKAKDLTPAALLPDWFYKETPGNAFQELKARVQATKAWLDSHARNSTAYGEDYLSLTGWADKKVRWLGWASASFRLAKETKESALADYWALFQSWNEKPLLPAALADPVTATSLGQLSRSLEAVIGTLETLLAQQHTHADWYAWKHFASGQPLPVQHLLLSLSEHYAADWKGIFSQWYRGRVLEKAARLFDLDGDTEELSRQMEVLSPAWRDSLSRKITHQWYLKRQAALKKKDLTFIKNLYNLRKNKQFGYRNSLRKILHTDTELFSTIFPVVLVNPVVCSSIFPLQAGLFDIVLLDEASQLRLEDTFAALLRGKTRVVSGDKHQMPPSGFFQSQVAFMDLGADSDEVEDEESMVAGSLAESESLLEFAGDTDFSLTYLDFHYRSRHPDLIQFSNAAFYGSRLVPMPAKKTYAAIQYHAVNGQYDGQGTNRQEAEAIVSYLFGLLPPLENGLFPSVGVGTFNINQRNLVWDLVMEKAYGDETASARLEKLMQSGLFIKNLENIQGDERDIMLLSTTFGPDEQGKFRQLFGPLTQSKGYQLLNVIVTRAREQVHIFSSFPDTYISTYQEELQEKGNTGKGILYAYLAYAKAVSSQNSAMQEAVLSALQQYATEKNPAAIFRRDKDNFRRWLFSLLQEKFSQYTIAEDHPFGGFTLDIAILDNPGNIVLAVMCEGGPFDGSPEAYRYLVYRRSMLQEHKLPVYFAWSYNWWRDSATELQKVRTLLG